MQLDTLYGPLDVPDWPDDLIVEALRSYGEWGAVEARLFAALLPDDTILWDCGAFLGSFTLGVARHRPLAAAVAIEANPELIPYLESNLTRLASCPVTAVAGGLGARQGVLSPQVHEGLKDNHGAQTYTFHEEAPESRGIPCHTLKILRARHGNYGALKLDIEGMEVDALKGDFAYIKSTKPILWVECNEKPTSLKCLSAMISLGYEVVYIAFPAFRSDNFRGEPNVCYPFAYEAALFAASDEYSVDIAGVRDAFPDMIMRKVESHRDLKEAMFDTPRWGDRTWQSLSRAELVGKLTRAMRDQTLGNFLE